MHSSTIQNISGGFGFFCFVFNLPPSLALTCSQLCFLPITKMLYLDYNHCNGLLPLSGFVILEVLKKKICSVSSTSILYFPSPPLFILVIAA